MNNPKLRFLAFLLALAMAAGMLSFSAAEGGTRRLTLYWTSPGTDYAKCDMWIWFPGKDGSGHLLEPCEYGAWGAAPFAVVICFISSILSILISLRRRVSFLRDRALRVRLS